MCLRYKEKLMLKLAIPLSCTKANEQVSLLFLVMKITTALLLFGALHVSAHSLSQTITLRAKDQPIKRIFEAIYDQTQFGVIFNDKKIDPSQKVTVEANQMPLETFLRELLAPRNLSYRIKEQTIFVQYVAGEKGRDVTSVATVDMQRMITGKVTDEEGNPLEGATVTAKGTEMAVTTDVTGSFRIQLAPGAAVLVFTMVGFETVEQPVSDQQVINISLKASLSDLDEVVVVGYGTQKKVNVTGSISTVNLGRIDNAPLTNAAQMLQGVEGVYVNQAGGQPGRDVPTIRIRGQGTLNNNEPLVLVNGIEYPLNNVNPNDIESISVLKDAASAAIYGSRAANGVILVTTKSGNKGQFQVDYSNYFGAQQVNYLPDVVKDPISYMQLRNQAQLNEGKQVIDYAPEMIEEYRLGMGTDPYTYPNNDWFEIMFKSGAIQNHNLRFSGGAERLTYSLSLDYLDQEGVLMGTHSNRVALDFNTTAQLNDKLKIGSSINGTYRKIDEPAGGTSKLMEMTLRAQAYHPLFLPDGRYANTFIRTPGHNIYRHPIALATEGNNNTAQQQFLINLFAEYDLPFAIKYRITYGINKSDVLIDRFIPQVFTYQVKTGAAELIPYDTDMANRGTRNRFNGVLNTTLFNTLSWNRSMGGRHNLSVLAGSSYERFSDRFFWAQREGYLDNSLYELDAGSTNPAVAGTSTKSVLSSFFGRLGYDFEEKYLFEANFRYDGSSRFAKGNRWGLFPSFSAGWRMDKEVFLENTAWLDELKLRASWGQLGNERIGLFRYVDLVTLGLDYPFGTNVTPGAAINAYNDPSITWETTTMSNIGLDAAFFNNRLSLVFDAFRKRTYDILREVNLPAQVGSLAGPIRNVGTVDNKGVELGLSYRGTAGSLAYDIGGSVTRIKNEVVDLKGQVIYNGRYIITEGYPINSYYMLQTAGIFQSEDEIANSPFQNNNTKPGYLKYADINNDNVITEDDRVITGGVIPEYTYQFSLGLGYKGFHLNAFFQGVQNVNTYAEFIGAMPFWFGGPVTKEWLTDAWTPDNPHARLPILTTFEGSRDENFRSSDFWLRDASYLRLKNIQLNYTVPQSFVNRFGLKQIKLFVNGQNLLTFSKMKDFDPEKNINGSTFYEYPTVKMYTGGINVTF